MPSLDRIYPRPCGWCGGTKLIAPHGWTRPCPQCCPEKYEATRPLAAAVEDYLRRKDREP